MDALFQVALMLLSKVPYKKLLRRGFSTKYLDYDPQKLCEVYYPDEPVIAPLVPYKEEICWIGPTLPDTRAKAGAVQVKRMAAPFALKADTDEMRTFQEEALKDLRAPGHMGKRHMGKRDDSVIRLESYSNNSGGAGAVLQIQKALYSDQVKSNLVMDWDADHALKKSGHKTLRTYLSDRHPGELGPLDESIMANTIGISVVLYYRTSAGAYRPYLPGRAPGWGVFGQAGVKGVFHCTASGAAAWSDTGETFEDFFVKNMYKELEVEVGIVRGEIDDMVPLALCREFLRGGKPQIFFAGVTSLSEDELQTRRRRAIQSQKKKGRLEIVDKQLIGSDTEDFRKKLLNEPLTLEATANLYYAEKFMKQLGEAEGAPMNEHAARIYFELCRETVLHLERRNKVCITKANILLTPAMALAGTAFVRGELEPWSSQGGGGTTAHWLFFVVFISCFLLIVFYAVTIFVRPLRSAMEVGHNLPFAEKYARNTASGQKVGQTLIDGALHYREMINYNSWQIGIRERALLIIAFLALVELGFFVLIVAR